MGTLPKSKFPNASPEPVLQEGLSMVRGPAHVLLVGYEVKPGLTIRSDVGVPGWSVR